MKRLFILLLLTTVFASCAKDTPKVLLFIRGDGLRSSALELMLTKEVGVMKEILEQSGFEVAVATVSGELIVADSTSLKPDLKLDEVSIADYAGFILPCMGDSGSVAPEAVTMVRKAAAEGKPVAAQLGSVAKILAEAGLLIGKKYAFADEEDVNANMFPVLKGGVYSGTGIVQDGNIITSGVCPGLATRGHQDGTQGLTRALIKAIRARTK